MRVPDNELGSAAAICTDISLPIRSDSPVTWTGCSNGDRPAIWPECRPGPVNSTGKVEPDAGGVEPGLLVAQQRLEFRQPPILFSARQLGWRAGGRCAGARRVFEAERLREAYLAHQGQRRLKVCLGLAGVANDEIGRERQVWPRRAQPFHKAQIIGRDMPAVHRGQHAVGA